MFQLSFGIMEFCPVGMPLADKWIIGFIHNSNIPFYQDQNNLVPEY